MTVMAEREAQMLPEEFEEIASAAPETVTLEFLEGRIGVKSVPDGDHDEIIKWLMRCCMQQRPDLWLYPDRGLKVAAYRKGRARADGALALDGHFLGKGEWADPEGVLMTVEVTSYDHDTDARDRRQKPAAYAAAGIPVYFLVDRQAGTATIHSGPGDFGYRDLHTVPFGEELVLPEPVKVKLDTRFLAEHLQ
ncbi:Uma2 family endonuclease [Streptomyces xiaopingdaonensis]|uniref:Uma2 family endonuclease n=1 Tax=Streptomyces xiaopingdaonensis TaxID=1565415 RepID=UPI0002DFAD3F|nr:Uma2 family endonuclease [Streptomyces xiaopingdaonensis]